MDLPSDLQRLAELIWRTSRNDEGTISAMGADVIALAIADSGWLHEAKAEAWSEGWAAYHAYYEAHTSDNRDNPYRD